MSPGSSRPREAAGFPRDETGQEKLNIVGNITPPCVQMRTLNTTLDRQLIAFTL